MLYTIVNRFPHKIKSGRLAVLFGKVNASGRFALRILNNRQAVFGAQLIGQSSKTPIRSLVAVELFARPHIYTVCDEVVVQRTRIQMRRH